LLAGPSSGVAPAGAATARSGWPIGSRRVGHAGVEVFLDVLDDGPELPLRERTVRPTGRGAGGGGVADRPDPPAPQTAPGQRGRDEMSGAAAETRSRVGRGADVPESVDGGRVAAQRGQWPPQKALVQLSGAAVWITADGVARILSRRSGACRAIRSSTRSANPLASSPSSGSEKRAPATSPSRLSGTLGRPAGCTRGRRLQSRGHEVVYFQVADLERPIRTSAVKHQRARLATSYGEPPGGEWPCSQRSSCPRHYFVPGPLALVRHTIGLVTGSSRPRPAGRSLPRPPGGGGRTARLASPRRVRRDSGYKGLSPRRLTGNAKRGRWRKSSGVRTLASRCSSIY
jgi:hypothetical protein